MSAKPSSKRAIKAPAVPSPELGYQWDPPASPDLLRIPAGWLQTDVDPVSSMVEELLNTGWRLSHLRELVAALGFTPEGNTRRLVAQQLAEGFLDPDRLDRAISGLTDEELRYFANLVLQTSIQNYHTAPQGKEMWRGFSTPWTRLAQRINKTGLALVNEDGQLFLPTSARQRLPQLQLPFRRSAEPKKVLSADPREILTEIQQLLGLLQSESFPLKARLRWHAPPYPFAQRIICWPPTPAGARELIARPDMEGQLELLPPEPELPAEALDAWTKELGCSEDRAEFLYALLVGGGIILSGSPITVDSALAQQWLALPPGRQVGSLYQLWRNITTWSEWWPLWREEQIRVSRLYLGYWGLHSIDDAVAASVVDLRGVLLELLSFLPHGIWLSASDLVDRFVALFPTVEAHNYLMGVMPQGPKGGWPDFLEAAFLRMVTGPLYALGLVDVGPSLDAVEVLRLRGLQDLHWKRRMGITMEITGQLRREALQFVEPESVLEITTPVPPDFVAFVLQWAAPAGFSRNLVRYRLDVQRLHTAFEHGIDPDALEAAWRVASGLEPLPEIAQWWHAWWQRYGRVRIYPAQALLQARDAVTMQELQAALPSLRSAVLGSLTPETVLLDEERVDDLVSDLTRQGYMPKEV